MMNARLTNTIIYWLLVVVPLLGLFIGQRVFGGNFFAIGLITYALIYRPTLNIARLLSLNKITRNEIWKFVVNPFRDIVYLKSIWMG